MEPLLMIIIVWVMVSITIFYIGYKQGRDVDDARLQDAWEKGYDMGVENAREFYRNKYEHKNS